MDAKELALKIRALRKASGLTQEKLAAKAGVARRALQRIEGATGSPNMATLGAIEKALKIDLSELYYENKDERFSPKSAAEMGALLVEFSKLPPVRRAFVLALIYRDDSFLDALPEEIHHDCQSLMKAL